MVEKPKDIKLILAEAIEKPTAEERSAYLDDVCGDDARLREEVESLLQLEDKVGDFLESPILEPGVTLDESPLTEGPGTTIGNYKLLEQIGEGGMAVVYMAEQEKPLRRRVALKIIKLGMDTKSVIARFEVERQALAVMDHPNIAKVFDAGTTETGRPYFVMELVRGVSISKYCDKNKLDTKERLDLFVQVCNAVQHAHQKGIIHRDIKPSNVMVTLHDGKPVPKVIDFGIAKATSQRLTEKTLFTRYAQMIGTPAYMSPEQAEMSGLDIDTRTDIYALGVLLYELLTGATPFSEEQLREAGYVEMQRIIREEEPVKPSTKLSTLGDTLTDVAEHRKASPDLLQKLVRGDLDWIVMKSLEKDRTRRYETANELVADIARHLNYEPVLAGPPSQIYRLRKFIRRHRTHAIGAAMVAVLLAGMAVVSVMYFQALNRGEEAEFLKHKDILSKAMEFRSRGQFQDALSKVEAMLSSKHVGPGARLLRARLILELQGPADAVKELQELINERDDIACQAHLLLARIYLESASADPEKTKEYQQKAREHQQKGEKLFSETAEAYFNQAMIVGTVKKTLECLNKAVELEPGHYDSRKARALGYYALRDYRSMERDAVAMTTLRDWDSLGYSLMAIALRETEYFADAIEYHNKAIRLSPDEAELYDQRRRTHMRMANYEQALVDARKCLELKPEKNIYYFHAFCALVALGRYEEAKVKYDTIIKSGLMSKVVFDLSAAKYVSDTLDAGLSWYPSDRRPKGAAFLAMHESSEIYRRLSKKAKRLVPQGFHVSWSPDGSELAYSHGTLGFSSIAILNLESGKTRLLTVPGKDPEWSPDGRYIVYVRDRQVLPLGHLAAERMGRHRLFEEEEVWLINADGTEEPRFVAKGGWPCWSSDSKRVFYHSRVDNKLCSISIEDGAKPTSIIQCPNRYPAMSPDDKYVAYIVGNELEIVELSTKSVVASWKAPLVFHTSLINWSPDGQKLSVPNFLNRGLWVYDLKEKTATKVLSGSFGQCSWSRPDMRKMTIQRRYGYGATAYNEIWMADTASLGPGRTIEEHYQEMVDYYTRRIDTEPENAGNYLLRAECYIYLDDQEKASADYSKAIELKPDDGHAWAARGGAHLQQRQWHEAVADYSKAIELKPEEWWYWHERGFAYMGLGQWEKVVDDYSKSISLNPRDLGSYVRRAIAYQQLGQQEKAIADLTKAIELNPSNSDHWHRRADTYTQVKQWEKALADYSKAIELNPSNSNHWRWRGETYWKMKQWEEALADISQAISLKPHESWHWEIRGRIYRDMERWDEAIADLSDAIELNPNNPHHRHWRGWVYLSMEKWQEAMADFSKAIELNPSNSNHWRWRGDTYSAMRQWDKAIADYSKAIELNPDYAYLPYLTALLHLYTDNIEEYQNKCDQMLERFGQSEKPEDLHWVVWTCALAPDAVEDLGQAVKLAEQSVESDNKNDQYLNTLGMILYRAGRFDDAVRKLSDLTEAWSQGKELPTLTSPAYTWFFLAMAHHQLGNSDEAKSWFDKVVERSEEELRDTPAWNRRLTLQLLRKESESLIRGEEVEK